MSSGIYAGWRRGGGITEALEAIAGSIGDLNGRTMGPIGHGDGGVAVRATNALQDIYDDGRVVVGAETDLYNLVELRSRIGNSQASPAAVIAALYERDASSFAAALAGRFAITIWDRRNRQLVAAVDPFGVGRLVYYSDPGTLLVGSRVDALAVARDIPLEINPRALVNLLNFSINLAPDTMLAQVKRLPPGHVLAAKDGEVRVTPYWDMRYGRVTDRNERRLARQLESVVERAVAATSAGGDAEKTGAFLSGGTDSSTVVGMLRHIGYAAPKAFSIGFNEEEFNELEYAKIAARCFGANHVTHLVGPEECFDSLASILGAFDEPFGNSSAVPTYFCARAAKERGVNLMLAGDGGDELFGGNERYATDQIFTAYHKAPRFVRQFLVEPLLENLPVDGGVIGRARRYVRRANLPPMHRFLSFQFLSVCPPETVFEDGFLAALGGYSIVDVPSRYYDDAPAADHIDRLLYVDVKITLGDSDLPKVTQMCDLAGVTVRFPYLHRDVAEFSGCIPANLKVKGFKKRYLFKKAFANLLPPEIIRKKKHGFGIPVSTWIKTDRRFRELARDTLLSQRTAERGYFRRGFVEDLFRKHDTDDTPYYGDILWVFLALEMWHRRVVDLRARVAA